jgi:transposase
MDELMADRGLSARERERVNTIRLLAMDWEGQDVADAVNCSRPTVYRRKAEYLAQGESVLMVDGWGGRRNETLTAAQEAELVARFEDAARRGEMITAQQMLNELAQVAGRVVAPSTVYRLLERHGWRKVVPRPRHPDADPVRQEAFKETSRRWLPPSVQATHEL